MASKVPWGAVFLGGIGTWAAVRTLWRPHKAVVTDGFVNRCAGIACDPAMVVETFGAAGTAGPILSTVRGRVSKVGTDLIELASSDEPVLVRYQGDAARGGLRARVAPGEPVGVGEQIGDASRVAFSVLLAWRDASGATRWIANEPSSWLAARGLRISGRSHPPKQWCEQGRRITVPAELGKCANIRLPSPGGFMLLPVSVQMG